MEVAAPETHRPNGTGSVYPTIFLVALAALLLEISYTRILSFKLYYFYTYIVIALSLLGLGVGGVLVTVTPALKRARLPRLLMIAGGIAATSVGGGYYAIAALAFDSHAMTHSPLELAKFALILGLLFTPFCAVGLMVSAILAAHPARISSLYFADLSGAALGCALAVPLVSWLSPPSMVMICSAVFASVAAAPALRASIPAGILAGAWGLLSLTLAFAPSFLPDQRPDPSKLAVPPSGKLSSHYSGWGPLFRVDVVDGGSHDFPGRVLLHDGLIGAFLMNFDGDTRSLVPLDRNCRSIPFRVLAPRPRVLIIGAAAGFEVLASLYFEAEHVTAVELNPVTYQIVTREFADYTDRFFERIDVDYVNDDGRSFLQRSTEQYDLIYFVAPDSYSAANAATSSAFVMAESYLYTAEMIHMALGKLTENGVLCWQYADFDMRERPLRTARYLSVAREALRRRGVEDIGKHVMVSSNPGLFMDCVVLIKPNEFSESETARFLDAVSRVPGGSPVHAWPQATAEGPIHAIVHLSDDELKDWYDSFAYLVAPVYDNSPFFWHFFRFRDSLADLMSAQSDPNDAARHESMGERALMLTLILCSVSAIVILLIPLWCIRGVWMELPQKTVSGVYFACLGFGFMAFEISLIQKLTLLLGIPYYSLAVTLMSMLLFAGMGSLASARVNSGRRGLAVTLFAVLAVMTVFFQFGANPLIDRCIVMPLAARAALAIAMLAPLSFCLGMFMPIGLAAVADSTSHKTEYVAWSWAVNGFFSVIGSLFSTTLSMAYGFRLVLLVALCLYALAVAAYALMPRSVAERV